MPTPYLTVTPAVVERLAALHRQEQMWAAAFLRAAAAHLSLNQPGCRTAGPCVPDPPGAPYCLLCALDAALERYSHGFAEEQVREFYGVGTITKQAAVDLLEANPQVGAERVCADLAARIHSRDLLALTAAEQAERALTFRCQQALERALTSGRIPETDPVVRAALTQREWMYGGRITRAGIRARELVRRDVRQFNQQAGKAITAAGGGDERGEEA